MSNLRDLEYLALAAANTLEATPKDSPRYQEAVENMLRIAEVLKQAKRA